MYHTPKLTPEVLLAVPHQDVVDDVLEGPSGVKAKNKNSYYSLEKLKRKQHVFRDLNEIEIKMKFFCLKIFH